MIILGLNAFHADSSAALVRDGKLIAAAEEERFRRIKHWAGFPSQAIAYCLREAGVQLSDVEHIAFNQDSRANFLRKIGYFLTNRPNINLVLSRLRNRRARAGLPVLLGASLSRTKPCARNSTAWSIIWRIYPRHFTSAPSIRRPLFRSMDSAISRARLGARRQGCEISTYGRVYFPHSLGIFYQALTQYLGFPHYGDEYKVMGLAPYGRPSFLDAMRKIVRLLPDGGFELDLKFFRHHREDVPYQWADGSPEFGDLFSPALEELLGPRRLPADPLEDRHRDIARSVQAMYEEAFFHLLDVLQKRCGLTDLALAGGCAMNSVANGKVRRMTPFRRVYVQAAAGDAGGAIGAAFAVWHKLGGKRTFVMDHAYWGPAFGAADIAQLLGGASVGAFCRRLHGRGDFRRSGAMPAHRCGDRGWAGRRLVSGTDGMGSARARQPLDPVRPASRRHEGAAQRQDQAARIISSVCAFGARGGRLGVVRRGRRRTVHDAGVSDSRGETKTHSRRHPRRRLRPPANGYRVRPIQDITV